MVLEQMLLPFSSGVARGGDGGGPPGRHFLVGGAAKLRLYLKTRNREDLKKAGQKNWGRGKKLFRGKKIFRGQKFFRGRRNF